jgi:hypothetical protein
VNNRSFTSFGLPSSEVEKTLAALQDAQKRVAEARQAQKLAAYMADPCAFAGAGAEARLAARDGLGLAAKLSALLSGDAHRKDSRGDSTAYR